MPHFSGKCSSGARVGAMLAFCAVALVACATPPPAPTRQDGADLSAFLPAGALLVASAQGDVDADGDDDVLMVYATTPSHDDGPRTLRVLLRDSQGALKPAVTNPHAILCRRCGGMVGDPMQPLRVGRGEFMLRFEGGSRELWSSEFRFEYAKDRGVWRLMAVEHSGFDRRDGTGARQRQGPADFGEVTLDTFDAEAFSSDALP